MGKAKQTKEVHGAPEFPTRKKATKKKQGPKWRHVGGPPVAGHKRVLNGKRPARQLKRRATHEVHNGHHPGAFVRIHKNVSDDDSDSDTEVPPPHQPKRRKVHQIPQVVTTSSPVTSPEEPKFNGPMYKIIRNGQVHRILVDPNRPGPSKEYEPLNSLVRSTEQVSEEDEFSEEISEEELSEEENYSDDVETGDSEHEFDEDLMRRMHPGGHFHDDDSDEFEYDSDLDDSEFRSDFDTDEEEDYYRRFMHTNESSDTDYDPGEGFVEDLYIPKGAAKTYSVDVMSLPFSPDVDEPQVVDVTEYFEQVRSKSPANYKSDSEEANGVNGGSSVEESSASPSQASIVVESESEVEEVQESSSSSEEEAEAPDPSLDDFRLLDVGKNRQMLLLKHTIFVNGVLDVELVAGHASLNGYELRRNSKKRIVSAKGYKYTNITPLTLSTAANGAPDSDFLRDFPDLETLLQREFDPHRHALLLLSRSKQTPALKAVQKFTQTHLFPTTGEPKFLTTPHCKKPLLLPDYWTDIELETPTTRLMVMGGKNVGKTTFVENLVNRSLNKLDKVLLVDLDVGQPVLLMPQVVSATVITEPLLGCGALGTNAENRGAEKMFLFGDINVMLSPIRYIECVKQLVAYCSEHHSDIPWVVNTMGFQKGLGPELAVGLIKLIHPTNVVQIQHSIESCNFESLMSPDFVNNYSFLMFGEELSRVSDGRKVNHRLHVLESVMSSPEKVEGQQRERGFAPVDKRTIMILAHLGDILSDHHEWFTDVKPVVCSVKDIAIKVVDMNAAHIRDAANTSLVNGNLVYLCHFSKNCDIGECLGIGIVRAVSTTQIFLLPALRSPHQMQQVNALVMANINLPVDVILRQSTKLTDALPYVYNTENDYVGSKSAKRGDKRFRNRT